jgi:hypothetical protein
MTKAHDPIWDTPVQCDICKKEFRVGDLTPIFGGKEIFQLTCCDCAVDSVYPEIQSISSSMSIQSTEPL